MNRIITQLSIYFNVVLISTVLFLIYKLGILDDVIAEVAPTTDNSQNLVSLSSNQTITDKLASTGWWQDEVRYQVIVTKDKQYKACLFGDSISSGLGNTLGDRTFNFALSGMSTISLIEQLKILRAAHVKCNTALVAMGTNDADYNIKNDEFIKNLKDSIVFLHMMSANRVILIPAFYSTVAASHNPSMAGSIARVNEINALIDQVAKTKKVLVSEKGIQPLFKGQGLKESLTTDGVHLNTDGRKIYREALLKILSQDLRNHSKLIAKS